MLTIRFRALDDVPLLKDMIYEFAEFERLSASITNEILARDEFGPRQGFAFSWLDGMVERQGMPSSSTTIRRLTVG